MGENEYFKMPELFWAICPFSKLQRSEMGFNDACLISISLRLKDETKKQNKIWKSLFILINTGSVAGGSALRHAPLPCQNMAPGMNR